MRLAGLLLPLVISGSLVAADASLSARSVRPQTPSAEARGLLWGGERFVTRQGFDRWLAPRGLSYSRWAAKHPSGRRILAAALKEPQPAKPPKPSGSVTPVAGQAEDTTATVADTTAAAPAKSAVVKPITISAPTRHDHSAVLIALLAAALALAGLAFVPVQRFAPPSPLAVAVVERQRILAAPAASIVIGVLIAKLSS